MARVGIVLLTLAAASAAQVGAAAEPGDLRRARAKVPRTGWRGAGFRDAMGRLNLHLYTHGLALRPCEAHSLEEAVAVHWSLLQLASPELDTVYADTSDRRMLRLASEASTLDHELNEERRLLLGAAPEEASTLEAALRDGRCHAAVMVFAHHLTAGARARARSDGMVLPLLPLVSHQHLGDSPVALAVAARYEQDVSCLACHVDPKIVPDPSADTPTWPPPLLPSWPRQFTARLSGFTNGSAQDPPGPFVTDTGVWYYDFTKDRFRADYINTYPDGSIQNHSQLWLPLHPAPNFFLFITKDNVTTCTAEDFSFLGLLRPDAYANANASYLGRLQHRGHWADRWQQECGGNFILYQDIETGMPLCDGGGDFCGDPADTATYWESLEPGAPPDWLFQRDLSQCKTSTSKALPLHGLWTSLAGAGLQQSGSSLGNRFAYV